jgi:hypothetical protein
MQRLGKVYAPSNARQRLGKHVPAATIIRNDSRIVGRASLSDYLCTTIVARYELGKDVPAATKNC